MSDPSGASLNLNLNLNPEAEAEAAAEHEQRAVGSGQRVSNAKINATQRCQLPVSQVALSSDYYPIYMQCILFSSFFFIFLKHFLISLCASAFGSYSVSIPSALCLSVTSISSTADPQTEPKEEKERAPGKQQLNGFATLAAPPPPCPLPAWLSAKCSAINSLFFE